MPALCADPAGGRAKYLGGTLEDFRAGQSGELYTSNRKAFYFAIKGNSYAIPYPSINLIEYGQDYGPRYVWAGILRPLLPWTWSLVLTSKQRDHFLTICFLNERGEQQAAVFEVEKKAIRPTLAALEARTGLKANVQDAELAKAE